METDRRPLYIWLAVLLTNIAWLIFLILNKTSSSDILLWLAVSLLISIVPILISKLESNFKHLLGYGIPLFPFVIAFYLSTGSECVRDTFLHLCDPLSIILALTFAVPGIVFIAFYVFGTYAVKWNSRLVLFLAIVFPIIVMGGALLLFMYPGVLGL